MLIIKKITHRFSTKLLQIYEVLTLKLEKTIQQSNMTHDSRQVQVIHDLQRLYDDLVYTHVGWKNYSNSLPEDVRTEFRKASPAQQKEEKKKGLFDFFGREFSTARSIRVPGLYMYGGSGVGKTFLSDIFFDNLPIQEKRKTHFHEFMASIHAELFELQKQKQGFDPVSIVAQKTAKKTRILYLDEFQVTDVADASILRRLFERLINNEMVLLATTNRPPEDLYKDGHQREFFLPFIDFVKEKCVIRNLDSLKDYRYELEKDKDETYKTYINPVDEKSDAEVQKLISHLTVQTKPYLTEQILEPIKGRTLKVPRSCNQVCVYYFNELMESTMGDSDFRAICKNFKAIIIRDMRKIKREERNIANRLIKLFDEAYFRNVEIYIEARVPIEELITPVDEKDASTEEDFAMIRCKSRLMEFQTVSYKDKLSFVEKEHPIDYTQQSKTENGKK